MLVHRHFSFLLLVLCEREFLLDRLITFWSIDDTLPACWCDHCWILSMIEQRDRYRLIFEAENFPIETYLQLFHLAIARYHRCEIALYE